MEISTMKVVNVARRDTGDAHIAGNGKALKEIIGACIEALSRGTGKAVVLDTSAREYTIRVQRVEEVADLILLPKD